MLGCRELFSEIEQEAFRRWRIIAAVDEAGRGSLAGPVAAAAITLSHHDFLGRPLKQFCRQTKLPGIRDSKKLSPKRRGYIFDLIKDTPLFKWRAVLVDSQTIDRVNIHQATLMAWKMCLKRLSVHPDFVFIDGGTSLPGLDDAKQQPVIGGDSRLFLVSLASIIAKVTRDRFMESLDDPYYGFARHKGYGTAAHLSALGQYGPSVWHRRSFSPVFAYLPFAEKVRYIVGRIPAGQTMTYADVAVRAGHPRAYRAVGNVLRKNFDLSMPCHRVVRSDGSLGGCKRQNY